MQVWLWLLLVLGSCVLFVIVWCIFLFLNGWVDFGNVFLVFDVMIWLLVLIQLFVWFGLGIGILQFSIDFVVCVRVGWIDIIVVVVIVLSISIWWCEGMFLVLLVLGCVLLFMGVFVILQFFYNFEGLVSMCVVLIRDVLMVV